MGFLPIIGLEPHPDKPVPPVKPIGFRIGRLLIEARRERLAQEIADKMTPEPEETQPDLICP